MSSKKKILNLMDEYIWLDGEGNAKIEPVTQHFWADLQQGKPISGTYLVTSFDLEHDFPHFEMHPYGDEVISLIQGKLTCLIELNDKNIQELSMKAGDTVVVPKGHWHRLLVHQTSKIIIITAGEGTQIRAIN